MIIDTFLARSWAGMAIATLFAASGYAILNKAPFPGMLLLVTAALLITGVAWSKISDARLPAPPGKILSVNGARLHIVSEGETNRSHPVVWIPGGHGEGQLLHHLHKVISTETRSILIDRPGSGWSETGSLPLTMTSDVEQVRRLLEAAGETGPFVLAGHSFGGMFSANFAHHYPELVAGLVLLDPTPPWNVAFAGRLSFDVILRQSRWRALAAQFGLGSLLTPEIDDMDSDIYRTLADHVRTINARSVQAKSLLAEASIFRSVMHNPLDLVIGAGALGNIPLVVISANESEEARAVARKSLRDVLSLTERQVTNFWHGLDESVSQQTRLSSRGQHRNAPAGAGHMFPYEHPEFVLTEVRKIARKTGENIDTGHELTR